MQKEDSFEREIKAFIKRVEDYCKAAGIAESTFCKSAIQNQSFMVALREGKRNFQVESLQNINRYMEENPPGERPKQGRPRKLA